MTIALDLPDENEPIVEVMLKEAGMRLNNGYTFRIVRPDKDIEEMMRRARDAQYVAGISDFADGVSATLDWLFDDTEPEPLEE